MTDIQQEIEDQKKKTVDFIVKHIRARYVLGVSRGDTKAIMLGIPRLSEELMVRIKAEVTAFGVTSAVYSPCTWGDDKIFLKW